MKQGDIYEQAGKRPVLIVSGNAMNQELDIVIACPLTSRLKGYLGCVLLKKNKENGLSDDSEVITFQIRAISKNRLGKRIGQITPAQIMEVIKALNEVLVY